MVWRCIGEAVEGADRVRLEIWLDEADMEAGGGGGGGGGGEDNALVSVNSSLLHRWLVRFVGRRGAAAASSRDTQDRFCCIGRARPGR